jgi:hypothetical protein
MGVNPVKLKRWEQKEPRRESYKIHLKAGFVIIVEYWWKAGKITRFATPLIRLHDEDQGSDEICRYDTAHNFAHLDILDDKRNVINKVAITGSPSYRKAITYAIDDLKTNYRKYWEDYCARQKQANA